jgi:hypothetical protein
MAPQGASHRRPPPGVVIGGRHASAEPRSLKGRDANRHCPGGRASNASAIRVNPTPTPLVEADYQNGESDSSLGYMQNTLATVAQDSNAFGAPTIIPLTDPGHISRGPPWCCARMWSGVAQRRQSEMPWESAKGDSRGPAPSSPERALSQAGNRHAAVQRDCRGRIVVGAP